jgi:trans-aconitate methyltransferase
VGNSPTHWSTEDALRYEEFADQSFSWRHIEEPCLRTLIRDIIHQDTKVLDLGCGGGRILSLLKLAGVKDDTLFGLDNDSTLLAKAKRRHPHITFIHQELTEVPYPRVPDGLTLVTAHMVFQYLSPSDMPNCLREIRRLLMPEGFLAIGVPHPVRVAQQSGMSYFARTLHSLPAPWGGDATSWGFTMSDYLNALIDARFKLLRIEEPGITDAGLHEVGANAYSIGPTRLMILAQAT